MYFLISAGIVLLLAIAIPSSYYPPASHAASTTTVKMRTIEGALDRWGQEHGRFPADGSEMQQMLATEQLQLGTSPFQRGRTPLEYDLELTPNASGPVLRGNRPGVIYYAVDPTAHHYYVTATTLDSPMAGNEVVMLREEGAPRVGKGDLPAVEPAAKK